MAQLRPLAGDSPTAARARFAGGHVLAVQMREGRSTLVQWRERETPPEAVWVAPDGEHIMEIEPQPSPGTRVAVVCRARAWLIEPESGTATSLGTAPDHGTAAWSPDGTRVAIARGMLGVDVWDAASGSITPVPDAPPDADPHSWDSHGLVLCEHDPMGKFRAWYYDWRGDSSAPVSIDGPRWQAPGGARRVRYRPADGAFEVERDGEWRAFPVRDRPFIGVPPRQAPWAGPDAWLCGRELIDLRDGSTRTVLDEWASREDATPDGALWLFRLADERLWIADRPAVDAPPLHVPHVERPPPPPPAEAKSPTPAARAAPRPPLRPGPPSRARPPRRPPGPKLTGGGGSVVSWLAETIAAENGERFVRWPTVIPESVQLQRSPDGAIVAWATPHVVAPPRIHDVHTTTLKWIIVLCDTRSGALRALPHLYGVNDFAFTPDGRHLVSASGYVHEPGEFEGGLSHPVDCKLRRWDVASGRLLREITVDEPALRALADRERAASSHRDGDRELIPRPPGAVRALTFTAGGERLFAFAERRIDLWAIEHRRGRLERSWPLCGLGLDARGRPLAERRDDAGVSVVELDSDGSDERLRLRLPPCSPVLARGGRFLVGSSQHGSQVWDLETQAPVGEIASGGVWTLAPDGRTAVVSDSRETVLRAVGASEPRAVLGTDTIMGSVYTREGTLVVPGPDHYVRLFDVSSGRLLRELAGGNQRKHHVAVDESRGTIAAGDLGAIARWSTADGRPLPAIALEPGAPAFYPCAFSPDGTTLACGSTEGVVAVCAIGPD